MFSLRDSCNTLMQEPVRHFLPIVNRQTDTLKKKYNYGPYLILHLSLSVGKLPSALEFVDGAYPLVQRPPCNTSWQYQL